MPGTKCPTVRSTGGDIFVKSGKHRYVAKCCSLRENWIDRIQDDRQRYDATRLHFIQHPGRRHAALGGVEDKDPADIGLAGQLMRGPAEDTLDAVEIVAGGKSVVSHQRKPAYGQAHGVPCLENPGAHVCANLPLTAASTHDSIDASIGR